jgi:outer membrane immunogenic protein
MKQLSVIGAAALMLSAAFVQPVHAQQNWSGLQAGINLGAAISTASSRVTPAGCFLTGACDTVANNRLRSDTDDLGSLSPIFGGIFGYNYQFGPWVVGAELGVNYDGQSSHNSVNRPVVAPLAGNFIHSESVTLDWLGTVRGKVGYAFDNLIAGKSILPFVAGGFAFGKVDSSTNVSFTTTTDVYHGRKSQVQPGWTIGTGAALALDSQWSLQAEYLYVDLGSFSYTSPCVTAVCTAFTPAPSYANRVTSNLHIVRLGLTYRFGAPAAAPPATTVAAPPPPPPAAVAPSKQMFIVFFEFDKSSLTADGKKVVDAAAAAFKAGKSGIAISGYTDLAGTQQYNLALSKRRAETVKAALVKDGVPVSAIDESWHGKENPRVPTADGVREPQNRRVEITM